LLYGNHCTIMHVVGIVDLIFTTLLALHLPGTLAEVTTIKPRGNPLGIDWDPAPSPEDGPPLSAGASRDKALLPAQISGIVGSYIFVVTVIGFALVLFGRRWRYETQQSRRALDVEMVQPTFSASQYYPSPVSPTESVPGGLRNFSWPSPDKAERNPYIYPSPIINSNSEVDPFVDQRVMEADREMLQRDLEDIYAHVMVHEEAKAAGVVLKDPPIPGRPQTQSPMPQQAPQRQQILTKTKAERPKPASIDVERSKYEKTHSRTSSIISALRSPKRKGVRGMQISSPIPTPLSAAHPSNVSDEEPLSPRYYAPPPPPPPVPASRNPFTHTRAESSDPSPVSPTRSIAEQLAPPPPREQRHRYQLSQTSSMRSSTEPLSAQSATSQTPLYPTVETNFSPKTAKNSNNSTRALPFRAFEPQIPSPATSHATKTTVLERTTPLSPSGLKTPWSAGAVPYSPYMPFTPLMPITPTLVTKEDRKRKKKEVGRGPVLELIKSDDEIWDSGY
jgi:hypothetical protein